MENFKMISDADLMSVDGGSFQKAVNWMNVGMITLFCPPLGIGIILGATQ